MNFKKLESGRSMVEMLGVLAIIGVLSVGGIAGYSLSMRRHRANSIADLVTKYALISYNNCQKLVLDGRFAQLGACSTDPGFEQSDIGSYPANVKNIVFTGIKTDQTTGVDTVEVGVEITDQKLCETVGSIAGTGCNSYVKFKIKQN